MYKKFKNVRSITIITLMLVFVVSGCTVGPSRKTLPPASDQTRTEMQNFMSNNMSQYMKNPEVVKSMTETMKDPKVIKAMADVMRQPEMVKTMAEIMRTPEMRAAMAQNMKDPEMIKAMREVMSTPEFSQHMRDILNYGHMGNQTNP